VSARETLEQRALRYIAERRLTVTWVDHERVEVRVRGTDAEHVVGYERGGWTCTCEAARFSRRCTHLHAAQLVTVRPARATGPLAPQRLRELQDEATATRNGTRRTA
jgi:hypothetical protein